MVKLKLVQFFDSVLLLFSVSSVRVPQHRVPIQTMQVLSLGSKTGDMKTIKHRTSNRCGSVFYPGAVFRSEVRSQT